MYSEKVTSYWYFLICSQRIMEARRDLEEVVVVEAWVGGGGGGGGGWASICWRCWSGMSLFVIYCVGEEGWVFVGGCRARKKS